MIERMTLKLGNMRKAADFIVYPFSEGATTLTIQSDKRIASIELATGKGMLSNGKGHPGFHTLTKFLGATEIQVDEETIAKLRAIQPKKGDHIGQGVYIG